MEEVYKVIKLEDDVEIRLQISKAYCGKSIHIYKDYYQKDELIKGFTFCMWDDYAFDAWPDNSDFSKESIIFIIDENDPLFFCFHRLLAGMKELIIDSDEYEENVKMLFIRRREDFKIELEFRSRYPKDIVDKYTVFIKNIGFDLRSKIDGLGLDTKERLFKFFMEAQQILLEEYHQISFDEYMLVRTLKKD